MIQPNERWERVLLPGSRKKHQVQNPKLPQSVHPQRLMLHSQPKDTNLKFGQTRTTVSSLNSDPQTTPNIKVILGVL